MEKCGNNNNCSCDSNMQHAAARHGLSRKNQNKSETRAGCTIDVDAAVAQFVSLQMGNNCSMVWTLPAPPEAVPLATSHCDGSTWMAACHQIVHKINISAKCSWLSLFSSSAVVNSLAAAARSYKHTYHTSTPLPSPAPPPLPLQLPLPQLPSNWIMRAAQWRTRCFR